MKVTLNAMVWLTAISVLIGCGQSEGEFVEYAKAPKPVVEEEHHHHDHSSEPGPHGGRLTEIGHGPAEPGGHPAIYYLEAMAPAGEQFIVHVLREGDDHHMEPFSTSLNEISAVIQVHGDDSTKANVKLTPMAGEPAAASFSGTIPDALHGKPLQVAIPELALAGEKFSLDFEIPEATDDHEHHDEAAEKNHSHDKVDSEKADGN